MKRTIQDSLASVDDRLQELRKKKIQTVTKTRLETLIESFNAFDENFELTQKHWNKAWNILDDILEESKRVYGSRENRDLVSDLTPKMKKMYSRLMQHNMEICFDLLESLTKDEMHVIVKHAWKCSDTYNKKMSVASYKYPEEPEPVKDRIHTTKFIEELQKANLLYDGKEYSVLAYKNKVDLNSQGNVVEAYEYTYNSKTYYDYFASDATKSETKKATGLKTIKKVDLEDYINICIQSSHVHRKESLYEAIFGALEDHIQTLKMRLENYDTFGLVKLMEIVEDVDF